MDFIKKVSVFRIFCICLLFLSEINIYSQEIESCPELDQDIFNELINNGMVNRVYYKQDNVQLTLCPDTELGRQLINSWVSEDKPVYVSESLFYIKKPEGSTGNDIDLISGILRSISSMEGIKYYSNSAGGIKTLYLQSYTVDNPYDKNRIPDQTDGSADNRTIYAFQEDNSFGVNTYQIDYRQFDNEISMVMKNEDPVKFAFITAVKKNNLVMSLQIIDKGSYLITYILAQMKFPALSIFESKMNNSLNARITALQNWFEESYFAAKITQEEIKE